MLRWETKIPRERNNAESIALNTDITVGRQLYAPIHAELYLESCLACTYMHAYIKKGRNARMSKREKRWVST